MWRRSVFSVLLPILLLLVLTPSVLAGGWAVTILDDVPQVVRAGETYRVGFTVLQHGMTPAAGLDTAVRVISPTTGETFRYPGAPVGAPGHYVAEVSFPAEGQWAWEVLPGWFAPQALGTLTVHASIASPELSISSDGLTRPEVALLRLLLPPATIIALGLFWWQLASSTWRRAGVLGDPRRAAAPRT